jgi:hypothetical protein
MIKINLLPLYVFEKQVVRRMLVGAVVAWAVVLLVCFVFWNRQTAALNELKTLRDQTKMVEAQVTTLKQQASAERGKIGPITGKIKFIKDVMDYNLQAPQLYEELARFTYEKIRYRKIELNDQAMQIDAYAPSLADAGRYLLNLYRATHVFSEVSMSKIPGYSSSENGESLAPGAPIARSKASRGFDFQITAKLAHPPVAPVYGAAAGTPGVTP